MGTQYGVLELGHWNNDSGKGSLPSGTKRLPEPMLTYHQRVPETLQGSIMQAVLTIAMPKMFETYQ